MTTQFKADKDVARQCSWFCHLICNNIDNLIINFGTNKFLSIYHRILQEATQLKKDSDKYNDIETLFNDQILKVSKYNWDFYSCEVNSNLDDILCMTSNFKNSEEIKKRKLEFPKLSINEIIEKINSLSDNIPVIINRYYMSFVIVKNKGKIIIFDSHYNWCGTLKKDTMKDYILYDNFSYNLITIGFLV